MAELKTSKYIVQDLHEPQMGTEEFRAMYNRFAKRILWIDGDVVDGAFQMNTSWYFRIPETNPIFETHAHDCDELIGFIGSDPNHPEDLGGELEVWLDGEHHVLTRSSMIFVPANMPHMPVKFNRVDRPIFHFSVVMNTHYDGDAYQAK
jgi:hypothetical protein